MRVSVGLILENDRANEMLNIGNWQLRWVVCGRKIQLLPKLFKEGLRHCIQKIRRGCCPLTSLVMDEDQEEIPLQSV